jgi:hypothetical protein
LKSFSAEMKSACAFSRSENALPTSGDSMTAKMSPRLTRWPGCASILTTRPVTGLITCETFRSSKVTRPLVTTKPPTGCGASGSTCNFAAATWSGHSQTSPDGGSAIRACVARRVHAPDTLPASNKTATRGPALVMD